MIIRHPIDCNSDNLVAIASGSKVNIIDKKKLLNKAISDKL